MKYTVECVFLIHCSKWEFGLDKSHMDVQSLYYQKYRNSFRLGTYLALLKTMSIAHLVGQLYGDSQLNMQTYVRLDRTRMFIKTLIQSGIDSEQSKQIIEHLNRVHANLPATNDDFLYVLSTFILEPIRFNQRFSQNHLTDDEVACLVAFWREVGDAMLIRHLPATAQEWRVFQRQYEANYQHYTKEGNDLASRSLQEVVKLSLPFGIRCIARQLILGALTSNTLKALGLAKPWLPFRLSSAVIRLSGD